jgi:hypothetical protein
MDNRKDARFPVQFRSSFSSANTVSGNGILSELSIRGCRISSAAPVKPGTEMELRFELSVGEPPIQVRQAVVRWSRDGNFGLEFINFVEGEWSRLQKVVKMLEKQPFQRDKQVDSAE